MPFTPSLAKRRGNLGFKISSFKQSRAREAVNVQGSDMKAGSAGSGQSVATSALQSDVEESVASGKAAESNAADSQPPPGFWSRAYEEFLLKRREILDDIDTKQEVFSKEVETWGIGGPIFIIEVDESKRMLGVTVDRDEVYMRSGVHPKLMEYATPEERSMAEDRLVRAEAMAKELLSGTTELPRFSRLAKTVKKKDFMATVGVDGSQQGSQGSGAFVIAGFLGVFALMLFWKKIRLFESPEMEKKRKEKEEETAKLMKMRKLRARTKEEKMPLLNAPQGLQRDDAEVEVQLHKVRERARQFLQLEKRVLINQPAETSQPEESSAPAVESERKPGPDLQSSSKPEPPEDFWKDTSKATAPRPPTPIFLKPEISGRLNGAASQNGRGAAVIPDGRVNGVASGQAEMAAPPLETSQSEVGKMEVSEIQEEEETDKGVINTGRDGGLNGSAQGRAFGNMGGSETSVHVGKASVSEPESARTDGGAEMPRTGNDVAGNGDGSGLKGSGDRATGGAAATPGRKRVRPRIIKSLAEIGGGGKAPTNGRALSGARDEKTGGVGAEPAELATGQEPRSRLNGNAGAAGPAEGDGRARVGAEDAWRRVVSSAEGYEEEEDPPWMKDAVLREIVFKVQRNEDLGHDSFDGLSEEEKQRFMAGLQERYMRSSGDIKSWLQERVDNLDYGKDGISMTDTPDQYRPRWRGSQDGGSSSALDIPAELAEQFRVARQAALQRQAGMSPSEAAAWQSKDLPPLLDALSTALGQGAELQGKAREPDNAAVTPEKSVPKPEAPERIVDVRKSSGGGIASILKGGGLESSRGGRAKPGDLVGGSDNEWKNTRVWAEEVRRRYEAESDPELKRSIGEIGQDLDSWITEEEIQEAALLEQGQAGEDEFIRRKFERARAKLDEQSRELGRDGLVDKYLEEAQPSNRGEDLWWLDLSCIYCIGLKFGGEVGMTVQGGFYSLDMAATWRDDDDDDVAVVKREVDRKAHIIAFENRSEAYNFVSVMRTSSEFLRRDPSVDQVKPKELYEEGKQAGFKVTTLRKGKLNLYMGMSVEDAEDQILAIGSEPYMDDIIRERSIDVTSIMNQNLGLAEK